MGTGRPLTKDRAWEQQDCIYIECLDESSCELNSVAWNSWATAAKSLLGLTHFDKAAGSCWCAPGGCQLICKLARWWGEWRVWTGTTKWASMLSPRWIKKGVSHEHGSSLPATEGLLSILYLYLTGFVYRMSSKQSHSLCPGWRLALA